MALFPLILALAWKLITVAASVEAECRCGPTDPCWPAADAWNQLNATLDGRLIKTVPIGSVCHDPTYDEAACAELRKTWESPTPHLSSSSSVMQQLWANASCDPFDPREKPCLIGEYVQYSVNVTMQSHVLATLDFVKRYNIRLVIRNTGHDDLGKSTGYGSVAVWMHHVTNVQYIPDYRNQLYHGPAVKVMAGDSAGGMLAELAKHGMVAVSGVCPSVGVAGGYTAAGGHSALSSLHGLSADNALEFEVITADGNVVTASPSENQDLYWALRGGGPGTFGIVWSLTLKTFKDIKVSAAALTFTVGNSTEDNFFKAIDVWHSVIPDLTDAGAYSYTYFYALGGFQLWPLYGNNLTVDQITGILRPLLTTLEDLGLPYHYNTSSYDTYYEAYQVVFQPWPVGGLFGSRLIPRDTIKKNSSELLKTTRQIFDEGGTVVEMTFNPNRRVAGYPDNAVLPAWRDSDIHMIGGLAPLRGAENYPIMVQNQSTITNVWGKALKELVPGGGAYMNEADGFDPDWRDNWYGINYPRLLSIKRKWDPTNLFWCNRAVGSESWEPDSRGVLCRT